MKNEVDNEDEVDSQLDSTPVRTLRDDKATVTPRMSSVTSTKLVTPASSGMEEGEIVDDDNDDVSDATTVVSPTRQRRIRSTYRNPYELNY